MASSENVKN